MLLLHGQGDAAAGGLVVSSHSEGLSMSITVYIHPLFVVPLVLIFIFVFVKTIIEIIP
jgi:hypothetical protein